MKRYSTATSLDFVEACHRHRVYPLMYCHMELVGQPDVEKLKNAVQISSKYIPEVLYSYDFRHNQFIDRGFTAEDVIQMNDSHFKDSPVWKVDEQPQLKIMIYGEKQKSKVIFGMSHILSDGAGFLQYLYLLASLYNGDCPEDNLKNKRDITDLLKNIHVRHRTEQTRYGKKARTKPLRPNRTGTRYYLIKRAISQENFKKLSRKARYCHATLNDVFMTAYARVIAGIQNTGKITIACPANLRRFQETEKCLTVANMTGLYKDIVIECDSRYDFAAALSQVHIEMELQKSRHLCFKGIPVLSCAFQKVPCFVLEKMVRAAYQLRPVSYSNIGVIEHDKLFFHDCCIEDCIITGAYRQAPYLQMTVSSFLDVCTLNCTLIGDAEAKAAAENILERVSEELKRWANEN